MLDHGCPPQIGERGWTGLPQLRDGEQEALHEALLPARTSTVSLPHGALPCHINGNRHHFGCVRWWTWSLRSVSNRPVHDTESRARSNRGSELCDIQSMPTIPLLQL